MIFASMINRSRLRTLVGSGDIISVTSRLSSSYSPSAHVARARDYQDHPKYYAKGDFPGDFVALEARLAPNAGLRLGNVAETIPAFLDRLEPSAPLGYVAVDVCYYWVRRDCLPALAGPPEQ